MQKTFFKIKKTFFKIKKTFFGIYIFGLKSPKNGKISRMFTIKTKKFQNLPPPQIKGCNRSNSWSF